jgi:2,3-bisphosphoglycerate-dependent phosphoglycerate mutase
MHRLVLLRHGATDLGDAFTGWLDVPLNASGLADAVRAGELLRRHGLRPRVAYTSALRRARRTCEVVLGASGAGGVPVPASRRLNERHYGFLQGRLKHELRPELGDVRYQEMRRCMQGRPPGGESLAEVSARVVPYWRTRIAPQLARKPVVLVVAHSNSLRALIKHLDALDDEQIVGVNVPRAMPLVYDWTPAGLRPGRYLEPGRASTAAAAVAAEGTAAAAPGQPLGAEAASKRRRRRPSANAPTPAAARPPANSP